MASRSLGTLTLDLVARIGGYTAGLDKAEREAKKRAQAIEKVWDGAGAALKNFALIGVAAAAATALAFDRLVKGAANFKDLEETTGASAEGLASMAVAADTAGVSMEEIAGNAIKLTKNLTGVDDESKAAGAAIKALGLNLDDFKKLDPVGQIDALTKAFNSFADGPQKAAVAVALWGKSGAEMLKVLKALEEQGGRTTILTQQQIDQADAYADAQAKATSELRLYAQAAATQALPALFALTEESKKLIAEIIGIDKETGRLAANNAVREFAQGAAVAIATVGEALVGLAKLVRAVGGSFESVFADIQLAAQFAASAQVLNKGGLFNAENRDALKKSLDARNKIAAEANERYVKLFTDSGTQVSDSLKKQFAAINSGLTGERLTAFNDPRSTLFGSQPRDLMAKPRLNFEGAVKSGGAKAAKTEVDEITKSMQALEKELAVFGQDESFKKALDLEGLGATTEQIEAYRANLARLEELKTAAAIEEAIQALVKERDELGLTNEQLSTHRLLLQGASADQIAYASGVVKATEAARAQKEAIDEGKRIYEATRTPAENLNIELGRLNELLQKGALDWDTYARAVFQAQDKFDATIKKTEEVTDSFIKRFAENTQDLLGQGLYDIASGNFKNIGRAFGDMIVRMMAEATAADIAKSLFGDLIKGGSGGGAFGGLLSSLVGAFGGAFADGGMPPLNKISIVGENGPELFVPRTAGMVVPLDKAQRESGAGMSVTNNFTIFGPVDRRTEEQIAAAGFRGAQRATVRRTNAPT